MINYKIVPRKNPMTRITKFYGQGVSSGVVKLNVLAQGISAQSTVTIHDVKAVLSALEEHIVNHVLAGNSVRLGDLGSFRASLKTAGAEVPEDFTTKEIKGLKVVFTPSSNFRYLVSKKNPAVQFQRVSEEEGDSASGDEVVE